jgi:hypothetical protein
MPQTALATLAKGSNKEKCFPPEDAHGGESDMCAPRHPASMFSGSPSFWRNWRGCPENDTNMTRPAGPAARFLTRPGGFIRNKLYGVVDENRMQTDFG